MQIVHVIGARPNFMKAAPVMAALSAYENVSQVLVHTGQHYDANMSDIFFDQLGLPRPDINLEVGSASHAQQTAQIMVRFEDAATKTRPDLVLVYGDVNSTVAAALVCAKLQIPVGHVEAGLRSFDRTMPEEINRLITDQIADLLFTPSCDGDQNLLREGVSSEKIHLVGNVMIDTLVRLLPTAEKTWPALRSTLNLNGRYCLVTLHRPSNVDSQSGLVPIMEVLRDICKDVKVLFPVHPRTRRKLSECGINLDHPGFLVMEPVGYVEFLALQRHSTIVITDSGGIQEETTFLNIPCLTMRDNTERPVTVTSGTNVLIGSDMDYLRTEVDKILEGGCKTSRIPPLWDGRAGQRIAEIVAAGKWRINTRG
jgi:UDP-N-acetylglucosamine 2-epimerase (non-hydrolysing)